MSRRSGSPGSRSTARFGIVALLVLGTAELLIPVWAELAGRHTPWHPEHIAERYGLFTIIVLGECVLAASTAVQAAIDAGELTPGSWPSA